MAAYSRADSNHPEKKTNCLNCLTRTGAHTKLFVLALFLLEMAEKLDDATNRL